MVAANLASYTKSLVKRLSRLEIAVDSELAEGEAYISQCCAFRLLL